MTHAWLNAFLHTSAGSSLFKVVKPALHFVRRRLHPSLPNDMKITRVQYAGATVALQHRRWSQSDALAIQQCFGQAQYNMPIGQQGKAVQQVYKDILSRGRQPLILDCGANIGASVRWLSLRYPGAHVIAVEPSPENCQLLRENTRGMDVEVKEGGIAAVDGSAYLTNRFKGAEMGFEITWEPTEQRVALFSVASLIADKSPETYEPFLLKVDIEGGERNLFSGDTTAIDLFPLIIMEPHDWLDPGQEVSYNFLQFHLNSKRDFAVNNENVASIARRIFST